MWRSNEAVLSKFVAIQWKNKLLRGAIFLPGRGANQIGMTIEPLKLYLKDPLLPIIYHIVGHC